MDDTDSDIYSAGILVLCVGSVRACVGGGAACVFK